MDQQLGAFITAHEGLIGDLPDIQAVRHRFGPSAKYAAIVAVARALGLGIYVIVDEYDNFTNEIVSTAGKVPYKEITHDTGFYRGWFKQFKAT